jgi:2-iminoacetate synthase
VSFHETLEKWPADRVAGLLDGVGDADVERALRRRTRDVRDLAALLSPAARPHFEGMAVEARRLTRRHFGRVIGLYAPIYLSNVCTWDCAYCGFSVSSGRGRQRRTLSTSELKKECETLAGQGFRQVLLVAGDAPRIVHLDYLAGAVAAAREYFPSVSLEVQALGEHEYRRLCSLGIEGVTLYMETYNRDLYARLHRRGTKADFRYRLDAIEKAGRCGARRVNIGALLGLSPWRTEGFLLGLHGRYLQRTCWRSSLSVSFPRLRHVPEGFPIPSPVGDADFVQLMLALRLFLPEAGFTLSTRERPDFRDGLIPLGVTLMSAGSSTRPGGYAVDEEREALAQFETEDRRSAREVSAALRRAGYDPVWKDFDLAFDRVSDSAGS